MEISQIPVKFVFHSYSESSTFGRPGLGRSIPHQMAILQIPALLSNSYLADPLSNGDFTDSCEFHISFLLWELNIWQTRSWQIYPPSNGNFTDSCSTLKLIFSRPTVKWQFHRFLLWQLTFHDSSYFIPTLRAQHLAEQVLADVPPFEWQFHWFLLWQLLFHSYSESLSFGRPGLGISTPPSNGNFTDSCSDSSHFMTAHISFLLWELNIWQTRSWQMYPHLSGNFRDCCSDNSYFILTLRAYHLADQVLAYLPPHPIVISHIPALTAHYSESSTFGRPVLGRCNPPHQMAN